MPELRLPRLPDRTPVKMTIQLPADLHLELAEYAEAYKTAYGQNESIGDLIPYMLRSFLGDDRGFTRSRTAAAKGHP